MFTTRQANERGRFKNEWLDSRHSFSFAEYYDPQHMGISVLRVINDDVIGADGGFPTHPHENMEIVTYVLEGELEHKDSMGNGSVIRAGDVQRMSAGTGVTHSEFNPSSEHEARLLQIWMLPNKRNITPGYAQKFFGPEEKQGLLQLLVSEDGREGSVSAQTDALLYATSLSKSQKVDHSIDADRLVYVHVATGEAEVNGHLLKEGDAATIIDESSIELTGVNQADVLLFDLPRI